MKKILIFFVLFLFPFLVNAEGNVVVSSVENIYEEESGISIDESESRNIIFNDIGQSFKYKVVLENISDETLVVENIKLSEPVVDFMKYGVFDIEVGEELEAGAKKELYVTVDSLSDKGYGYNFADTLNLEVVFNEKVENPITVDIIVLVILSFVVSGVFFIYYKYNNKVSLCFLFIPLMIGGISFVSADNFIKVTFESNVAFESQNVLETTGIYFVKEDTEVDVEDNITYVIDHSHEPKFDKVVDIWEYRKRIKNIYIENTIREIDEYAYKFDISEEKNERVIAYLIINEENNTLYDCYIMANGLIYANKNSQGLFAEMYNLEVIDNLAGIDFSESNILSMLFYNCQKLKSIDLRSMDTSGAIDMSMMFSALISVEELDVSNFDTTNVVDMYDMFFEARSIKSLDVSNFDTSKVVNMYGLFGFMNKLENLELGNFETANVTNMAGMFFNLVSLKSLDVSTLDTSNVTNMFLMFGCDPGVSSVLEEIKGLENFDTSKVQNMNATFQGLTSIKNLNLSNFDTSNVTEMQSMFCQSYSLEYLDLRSFDFTKVNSLHSAFALTGRDSGNFYIDFSGFDFTNFAPTDYGIMLSGWKSTYKIYVMNEGSKNWFINKKFTNITENNVLIKNESSNVVDSENIADNNEFVFDNVHYYSLGY